MTATPIAQDEQGSGCRRGKPPVGLPLLAQVVTRKCPGIMARPKVDIAMMPLQIIDAVGNHHALCQTRKGHDRAFPRSPGCRVCPADTNCQSTLFLVSMLTIGEPRVVYSSLSWAILAHCASRCAHSPVR